MYRGKAKYRDIFWECRCVCGRIRNVKHAFLLNGHHRSCGCVRYRRHKRIKYHPDYHLWSTMIQRCTNPKRKGYHNYGGRGITVCERWRHAFENFTADMGPRPSPTHSLERRDNDQGYSPENCYWATWTQQRRNTRFNVVLTFQGETLCITEWALRLGIKAPSLKKRLVNGWTIEAALSTPKGARPDPDLQEYGEIAGAIFHQERRRP
jgi:hypothetical protein